MICGEICRSPTERGEGGGVEEEREDRRSEGKRGRRGR